MTTLPTFWGREIATAVVEAIEALPKDSLIVTLKAGENMPITIAFIHEDDDGGLIPEYAWTGETFREIGFL